MLNKFIKHGTIPKEDVDELNSLRQNDTMLKKQYYYHDYLARRYLLNNHQPSLARKHLISAIKIKHYTAVPYFLFLISFFGFDVIRLIRSWKQRFAQVLLW